jgi:SAM-dependent methyltransferase
MKLPNENVDYIFSSHCLEHLDNWVDSLNYWIKCLNHNNGIIFLYLPHYSQEYWRTWNNRKHKHNLNKQLLLDYFKSKQYLNYLQISDCDLNHSFAVIAEFKL